MTKKHLQICVVCDKWCDGDPAVGLSNNLNNITRSLEKGLPESIVTTLYYDMLNISYGTHIDDILPRVSADVFIFCFLGNSFLNPSSKSLAQLKGKKIFIWPDTVWPWVTETISSIDQYADLHVAFDGLPNKNLIPKSALSKFVGEPLNGISPQNPDLYYPEKKEIDICFLGTIHSNRQPYVDALKSISGRTMIVGGGQRDGKLSPERYAEIIRKSKICLNLSLSPTGSRQLKGRVMESMASKTCIMEELPSPITGLLPRSSYLAVSNPEDMANILLNTTDGQSASMADEAYEIYKSTCESSIYWKTLLDRLD
jgi:hypothetical protein